MNPYNIETSLKNTLQNLLTVPDMNYYGSAVNLATGSLGNVSLASITRLDTSRVEAKYRVAIAFTYPTTAEVKDKAYSAASTLMETFKTNSLALEVCSIPGVANLLLRSVQLSDIEGIVQEYESDGGSLYTIVLAAELLATSLL